MRKKVVVIGVVLGMIVLLIVIASTKTNNQPLNYEIVFVTSWDSCSDRNYNALQFYDTITNQYLTKYGIRHQEGNPLCISQSNIDKYTSTLQTYDLPIIILDMNIGANLVFDHNEFGEYEYGNTQTIIICACTPFVESDTSAWTLSHELSHFALHFKGYPYDIFVNWVHSIQAQANSCVQENLSLNQCPNLWTTVTSPAGKEIKMMKIYDGS